ncbi:MAG: ATP-binding protein [Eubacterium sp.]|nr:ATP-binding protein [Eubacterium sp.]
MGIYLNPKKSAFQKGLNSQIYVDKSELIAYTNKVLESEQQYVCVSRPRRFGKSMAANMLAAYYGRGADSKEEFKKLKIGKDDSFSVHLNQYNVIFLNMQDFLSENHDVGSMRHSIEKNILWDLLEAYPDIRYYDSENLIRTLSDIYNAVDIPFIFIIDEWDCIFREKKEDKEEQKIYLDFLRNLLKDKQYVALAYMTGILPIKKYGTHSALNMFDEFSMTNPKQLAEFVGFTESEVKELCCQYGMDFEETKRWYDGYRFENLEHVYSPRSVVSAMLSRSFDSYWNQTETFEALRDYIALNYAGLKDTVIELLAGSSKKINTSKFTNDMTTFKSADDVLTLLIHLGYLGYDYTAQEVFIPNSEVASEFYNAVEDTGWETVVRALQQSDRLLKNAWNKNAEAVAKGIEEAHFETSILKYNDENSLACVISLAFYSARAYYTEIRELPSGQGFADIVYLPRKKHQDKPAMIVELKWDKSAEGAIEQIKTKKYVKALEEYKGNLLLIGVNYSKDRKEHQCIIEEISV